MKNLKSKVASDVPSQNAGTMNQQTLIKEARARRDLYIYDPPS